jgi:transposase
VSVGEEEREEIRRAYYVEGKSQREIAKAGGRSRKTVKQIVENERECRKERRSGGGALEYEPYRARVEELLEENKHLPMKQQYTAAKIYEVIGGEGYHGCESRVRQEVGKWKKGQEREEVYVPLSFEPGEDAQCDWGEALVVLAGREVKVQVFVKRMCYSRKLLDVS